MADIKVQAVKAVCYEIALSGFKQTRNEVEAACVFKLQELCQFYGKRDPNPSETFRAVARDVMDTIGFCGDEICLTTPQNSNDPAEAEKIEIKIAVKQVLSDIVFKVAKNDDNEQDPRTKSTVRYNSEIENLKESMSVLVNMFRGVKMDNASKEEEMKAMKMKMQEMEKALNANAEYGKSLLLQNFVNYSCEKSTEVSSDLQSPKQIPATSDTNSIVTSTTSEGEKDIQKSSEISYSPRYIHSNDFSEPSHGVVVPDWIKTKEEKIDWLMENDIAFRRGRLRWEAQQKRHQANLRSQELNKEKRRLEREKGKATRPQPRFPFKSATKDPGERKKLQKPKPSRNYFEGPRRKTCSALKETEVIFPPTIASPPTSHKLNPNAEPCNPKVETHVKLDTPTAPISESSFTSPEFKVEVKRSHAVTIKTEDGREVKWNREPYATQRRKTWCNPSPTSPDTNRCHTLPRLSSVQPVVYPNIYRSARPYSAYQGREWVEYLPPERNWSCLQAPVLCDPSCPSFVQSNVAYVGQSVPKFVEERYNPFSYEAQFLPAPSFQNQYVVAAQAIRRPAPPVLLMDQSQCILGTSLARYSPPVATLSPQSHHNCPYETPTSPSPISPRKTESPPYMSTLMNDKTPLKGSSNASAPKPDPFPPDDRSEPKRKVAFKGVYLPPFRRKNLGRHTEL